MLTEKKEIKQPVSLLSKDILAFFLKLLALVVIWEVSYYFVLEPARIPDKLLTNIITAGTTGCFNVLSQSSAKFIWSQYPGLSGAYIFQNGKAVLLIADICNGLNLIAIYIGFIILLPNSLKRKISFIVGGIIALTAANIIRCVLLYWLYKHYAGAFDFNHHYVFTILMYLLIFYGWILFTKGGKINESR